MPAYRKTVKVPGKSAQELYDVVSKDVHRFFDKISMHCTVVPDPSTLSMSLEAKGVTAKLICEEGSMTLDGSLSLFLVPFKSKIDEGIDRWVAKMFG